MGSFTPGVIHRYSDYLFAKMLILSLESTHYTVYNVRTTPEFSIFLKIPIFFNFNYFTEY